MRWRWHEAEVPGTPWVNMATDIALFHSLGTAGALPIVRIYTWDRPAVSCGRLQDRAEVEREFPGLPVVRRPTGGRAVLHGEDLTVSVVARQADLPLTQDRGVMASYRQIVLGLVDAFAAVGKPACLGGTDRIGGLPQPVDCFAVAASCDVVAQSDGRKLMGCAQRRRNGAVLQQMSIPLKHVPDRAAFLLAAQDGMGRALGVGEWLAVDTPLPV